MIPVVSYSATRLPFILELPIVRKRISATSERNFNDKAELVSFVDSIRASRRVDGYVGITCSCGNKFDYATKDDVPSTDVVCSCGRDVLIYGS